MALPNREIGSRIRTVREQLGVSTAELGAALGTDGATVERLEAGLLNPVPGDYVLIAARFLHADFRYFISTDLDDVEHETHELYRALAEPSAADRQVIRRFMYFCMCERDLEDMLSLKHPLTAPIFASDGPGLHKDQGKQAAAKERQRLGLGDRPIENVFELLRSQGVRLFRHTMEKSDLSGLTALHPKAGVCVLVNYEQDLYRQFFSAAHEYAHVLFDRAEVENKGCVVSFRYSESDLLEMRANAFAAEFLLPLTAFNHYSWPGDIHGLPEFILRIARDYHVNTVTVAIRLKEARKITEKTLASFKAVKPATMPRSEKRDPDIPSDLSPTQQRRREVASQQGISSYYLHLLRQAFTQEHLSLGRMAELLDMRHADVIEFIREVGVSL